MFARLYCFLFSSHKFTHIRHWTRDLTLPYTVMTTGLPKPQDHSFVTRNAHTVQKISASFIAKISTIWESCSFLKVLLSVKFGDGPLGYFEYAFANSRTFIAQLQLTECLHKCPLTGSETGDLFNRKQCSVDFYAMEAAKSECIENGTIHSYATNVLWSENIALTLQWIWSEFSKL